MVSQASLANLTQAGKGRPKGALNKRTRLLQQIAAADANGQLPLTPKQVLAENMAFYQKQADQALEAIREAKDQGIPISVFGKEMDKVVDLKDRANEAAKALAPYIHPRLAHVEVKTEQVQPFVIRVPAIEADPQRWADSVNKVIDVEPSK